MESDVNETYYKLAYQMEQREKDWHIYHSKQRVTQRAGLTHQQSQERITHYKMETEKRALMARRRLSVDGNETHANPSAYIYALDKNKILSD